ncbi:Imm32 family immunity protein [Catellatospora tritici]|uniref:Imm32 family immunity protein n=1 Tax=Catellatospora tritici TaxID=2851566 RepID=UPI001C2D25EF|nr:hypothetical protein [Catellatospora tritici]
MQVLLAETSGELELSGTRHELLALCAATRSVSWVGELDTAVDPSPYTKALHRISSNRTEGKVVISLSADVDGLDIQGGAEALEVLMLNIEALATADDPDSHAHIEYHDDHVYLSEQSSPLVVALLNA